MSTLLAEIGALQLGLLLLAAFVTSMVHGATGLAGGFLLAIVAAPILGLKALVPVLSLTLLISHGARAWFNIKDFDRAVFLSVIIPALPCIILAAMLYGKLSSAAIAFLLGSVVLISIPLRRWATRRKLKTTKPVLFASGAIYGGISGAAIGPGTLLVPVLLGRGLSRVSFVATLAAIALTTNLTRLSVYGLTDLLSAPYLLLGLLTGLATIPGAWVGRRILKQITDERHTRAVEWLLVLGGLNFFWMGFRALSG